VSAGGDGHPGRLEEAGQAPSVAPGAEPPETTAGREREWVADHEPETRDMRPAIGTRGGPGSWHREGDEVALARPRFGDAQWSFLYKSRDTRYAAVEPGPGEVAEANRRMRSAPVGQGHGPFIKPPVWTWEVPLYFWVGGVASGSSFVALACDLAGDTRSAALARKVALGAVAPAPLLLVADLGRPERFLNMLRIFKPRSPMNMGAWCLVAFSGSIAGAVGADLLDRPRVARGLGGATALLGGYLGSYTGVLLAATAVPLWARSRSLLGPIFIATATATGAAATRLTLVARGLPHGHPTRTALGTLETASILTELTLSALNERRIGKAKEALHQGGAGWVYRGAKAAVVLGLSTRLLAGRRSSRTHDLASGLYLAGGLAFRFAWVYAGKHSAADHESMAELGREGPGSTRAESRVRTPRPVHAGRRVWGEAVRRTSLAVERLLRRGADRSAPGR
jgi:formate-dependent nitrite reductase membrane component NrfD